MHFHGSGARLVVIPQYLWKNALLVLLLPSSCICRLVLHSVHAVTPANRYFQNKYSSAETETSQGIIQVTEMLLPDL